MTWGEKICNAVFSLTGTPWSLFQVFRCLAKMFLAKQIRR
jgi:hypothetical protein